MSEGASGHAYIDHLLHEHDRLNKLLLEIGREVANLSQASPSQNALAHLAQQFADLRRQLQAHFAEEEAGGCLEEAVTRCPSLGIDSNTIVAEHPFLDRMLDQLVTQTRNLAVAPADVQRDFREFVDKLHAHEEAENRLLQMAFGAESADYDV